MNSIDVLFSPAEFEALTEDRLREGTCVVFDILRATSSIITALAHGASAMIPVETIEEAVAAKRVNSAVLLAGEREGFRITAKLSGSVDFDFGNSPREFAPEKVSGRTIVMTTTNGTRALKACHAAREVLPCSFLNMRSTVAYLRQAPLKDVVLVCSGTHEEASLEDTLAAGTLVDSLWPLLARAHVSDAAQMARFIYHQFEANLNQAMTHARNGRRLLGIPELREDVSYCLQRDTCSIIAKMQANGSVVRIS